MRKCRQRTLDERSGLYFNIEEMASGTLLVKGLPYLGSSYSEVLSSAKRLRYFFMVERADASAS
jgi:hypothetical protein